MEAVKAKTGRKCLLNEELMKKILEGVDSGVSYKSVCGYAGISEPSFYGWLKKGKEDQLNGIKSPHKTFYEELQKHLISVEVDLVKSLKQDKDWRAKAFILERRFPETWGKQQEKEEEKKEVQPIVYNIKDLSDEELHRLIKLTEKENDD